MAGFFQRRAWRKRKRGAPRVLMVNNNYPTISESYQRVDIDYARSKGIDIAIHSLSESPDPFPTPTDLPIYRGKDLRATLRAERPDVLYVHWLKMVPKFQADLDRAGLPTVIRGHSFDFSKEAVEHASSLPYVKRIFLFPHYARRFQDPKVRPMTVAVPTSRYYPPKDGKRPRSVVRAGPGLATKDLETFIEAADLAPEFDFHLIVASGRTKYPDTIRQKVKERGGRVRLSFNLLHEEAADEIRKTAIHLRSHDAGEHPYGMPQSIAEGMATGCYTVARDDPAAREYIGGPGAFFQDVPGAAAAINATLRWDEAQWATIRESAIRRAKAFHEDVVLPRLLESWHEAAA